MKRVSFSVQGQGFAAEVDEEGNVDRRFWIVGSDGQEVEDVGNVMWNNFTPSMETEIRDAAATAARERE